MLIHLLRHADYDALDSVLNGMRPGLHLNANGREQARRLTPLAGSISAVVTSPLERAIETAGPLARLRGIAIATEPGLQEIDYGTWTGRTVVSLEGDPAWALWNNRRSVASTPGGETMVAVQARAVGALGRLRDRMPEADIAVVSHADVIRAVLCAVLGLSLDLMLRFEIAPASRSTIRFEPWGATVVTLNRTLD